MITSQRNVVVYVVGLFSVIVIQCHAFGPLQYGLKVHSAGTRDITALFVVPPDAFWACTLTTAVDVFDGSGIDPVVVSDAFWSRLQGNFISVLVGNFLAALVFSFIMSQAATQLSNLGSVVTNSIFKGDKGTGGSRASTTSTLKRA
jgi:hypothetical protein